MLGRSNVKENHGCSRSLPMIGWPILKTGFFKKRSTSDSVIWNGKLFKIDGRSIFYHTT